MSSTCRSLLCSGNANTHDPRAATSGHLSAASGTTPRGVAGCTDDLFDLSASGATVRNLSSQAAQLPAPTRLNDRLTALWVVPVGPPRR